MKQFMFPKTALLSFAVLAYAGSASAIGETPETLDGMYNIPIDSSVIDFVNSALPEATVNADYINPNYDGYLSLNQNATVSVSFLNEGAGYRNSVGYFTFEDGSFDGLTKSSVDTNGNGNISLTELSKVNGTNWGWLYPNASKVNSGGVLQTGDTVDIAGLNDAQNIGFFLAPDAWNGQTVVGGSIQGNDGLAYYSTSFLNPESWSGADFDATADAPAYWDETGSYGPRGDLGYGTNGAYTHTTLLSETADLTQVIMGFEDLRYGGDKDYNDVIFMVTATPATAFGGSNIATAPVPSLSGGVFGLLGTIGVMMMGGRRRKA